MTARDTWPDHLGTTLQIGVWSLLALSWLCFLLIAIAAIRDRDDD